MALGIDGLRVGTWEHDTVPTGCTVLLPPDGSLAAMAVRGESPGTREAAALGPFGKLSVVHGIVLSGGSAYGLAVADGVMRWLEEQGVGYPVGDHALVPIVGAAIVLDLSVGLPGSRPDADAGRAACEGASLDDPPEGARGAGAGCTVAKVGGLEHLVVGAIVVNNAVGEVLDEHGEVLIGTRAPEGTPLWPRDVDRPGGATADDEGTTGSARPAPGSGAGAPADAGDGPAGNTVVGAVVTNAVLDKRQAHRVADLAHDGIARAVEPSHTSVDGDALFCVATGAVAATVDRVSQLAVRAIETAARRGPVLATGVDLPPDPLGHRLPGWADTA